MPAVPAHPDVPVPPAAAAGRGPARPSLLLADDDPITRMVTAAFLQALGYTDVQLAADGEEALALCARQAFDLVLMDCLMPGLGGLEATRRLRARGQRVPVIALTASTGADDIARCLEAGMDGHLAKPIDLERLAATLSHWLAPGQADPRALN
ncbi:MULTISPECIES: response regulator [Ramlibacter]|nr:MULTISPECIES: response regulator [Ramlibacter]MBA2964425.1 response regulator [Ramlibacter sp. CGMCC 1.13660]